MKEYYTIDDVATMTMLSTRTLRNYIKNGFLQGDKVEGICNQLIALINTNQYGEILFSYQFEEKKKLARIIISGGMDKITDLMRDYQLKKS